VIREGSQSAGRANPHVEIGREKKREEKAKKKKEKCMKTGLRL
jgi:hypothetical protein